MSAPFLTRVLVLALVAMLAASCSQAPFTLSASQPWRYTSDIDAPLERLAILVTITNRSGDDLAVNPADFVARDAEQRVYASNPKATDADARAVRLANVGNRSILPLPTITLRQDDVLSGFVVFDVPAGVRPVELIWRQSDSDSNVALPPSV